jgi:hypothetical protein
MTKVNSVGISLPTEIISKIDTERGDIPRSRYILRVLRDSNMNKLKEEGRSSTTTKNNNSQDSPDREVGSLQSSESRNPLEFANPMSQDTKPNQINKNLCDCNGCSREATTEIEVNVGELGIMKLNLCEGCKPKFNQSITKENQIIKRG